MTDTFPDSILHIQDAEAADDYADRFKDYAASSIVLSQDPGCRLGVQPEYHRIKLEIERVLALVSRVWRCPYLEPGPSHCYPFNGELQKAKPTPGHIRNWR